MRRRDILALMAMSSVIPLVAQAQSLPVKVVGVLGGTEVALALFAEGLADTGWIVGQNVTLEHRPDINDPEAARLAAEELVALGPDALYGLTTFRARALVGATTTIPVVFSNVSDPVGNGLVDNIARPGGNATGFMFVADYELGRFVQLFRQTAPSVEVLGYLVDNATTPAYAIEGLQRAAAAEGLSVQVITVGNAMEYATAISGFAALANAGLVVDASIVFWINRAMIVDAVRAVGIPAIYFWQPFVEAGGLMSYGVDELEPIRHAGTYVGRILNGARPGDLPVQASSRFRLALNLSAAEEIGIAFPLELLATADQIIQ